MPQDSEIFRLRMKNSLADGHSKFRHRACKSFCTEFIDGWSQPASQSELVLQSTGLPSAHERDWSSASSKGPRALCLELFSTSRFILNSYMLVSLAPAYNKRVAWWSEHTDVKLLVSAPFQYGHGSHRNSLPPGLAG